MAFRRKEVRSFDLQLASNITSIFVGNKNPQLAYIKMNPRDAAFTWPLSLLTFSF